MEKRDVIIIGGGASGVALAINLKKVNPNLKVTLLEQNDKILKKVLKTGNGKCNISNYNICKEYYHNYEHFEKWIDKFDVEKYFEELGIIIKKDDLGRYYPLSEASNSVVDILRYNLEKLNVEVKTDFLVERVEKKNVFTIYGKEKLECKYLVIATGSYAQSKTNGYDLAKSLNHSITDLKPGLTPIKVKENVKSLQGIRIKCKASVNGFERSGEILFKEDAISGILSLELSRHVKNGDIINIDLIPSLSENELYKFLVGKDLDIALNGILPKMVGQYVLKKSSSLEEIVDNIKKCKFTVKELYGYNYSQIVCGGVKINEIKDTFESKKIDDLYIVGELLDIDGDCGGFNLYFAWLSAYVASLAITKSFTK